MKYLSIKIFLLSLLVLSGSKLFAAKSPLIPSGLRIEYLENPLGLDVEKPRFGWVLISKDQKAYGQKQSAYRILVASSPQNLRKNKGDVWDSDWISSSQMNQIVYGGKKLNSDRKYYWKVAVKDEKNGTSAWSEEAYWTTGLLREGEWKAAWIGGTEVFDPSQKDCNIWDPWLRKGFDLKFQPQKANLYVASIGFHEVYVNGQRVGDEVMAPAVTDHTKRARYVVYDLVPYLKKGKNVIGIWLGTSWSIFAGYDVDGLRPLLPMVSAQVDMFEKEEVGRDMKQAYSLRTDTSWKIKNSPNKLLGIWDFGRMGGELWDDRRAEEDWNDLEYEDKDWANATLYTLPLKLSAQNVQGNRVIDELNPVSVEQRPDGSFRVDMGVNFAGWTEVKLKGKAGQQIDFYYSEREKDEMTFNLHSTFILGEKGEGTFKNRFNYSSGRWITIKGLEQKPDLNDIKGYLVRTDYQGAGTFESSDPLQNWIYDRVKWTFENLSLGGFIVDCPQRERMGYGGDAHATSETGMLNYQLGAFYTKWMQDWRDVQGTEPMVGNMHDKSYARKAVTSGRIFNNGILPHTAPTYWGGGGPSWGGIVVTLPWFMYQQYGDRRALEENYVLIKGWLDFLDTHVEGDLLQRFGGTWDFLGDWLWPNATAEGMNNDKPETWCLNNSYRVYNLRTAANIAAVLGDSEQASMWRDKADRASKAINNTFYDEKGAIYADGSMANLATALLAGVVPEADKDRVMKNLEAEILVTRSGHIHAGITGGALLFKWLREQGRNDLIYSMTSKTTYPSWGYMKENDATTIWEMWEKDLPGHSLLHSSYLYPGAWYIDGLAGIKMDEPGYTRFIIEPPTRSETNLEWVKASFDSPAGKIESQWERKSDSIKLVIIVPPNTTALLKLAESETIRIKQTKNVIRKIGSTKGKVVYELQSGHYSF